MAVYVVSAVSADGPKWTHDELQFLKFPYGVIFIFYFLPSEIATGNALLFFFHFFFTLRSCFIFLLTHWLPAVFRAF